MKRTGNQLIFDYSYKGGLDAQGRIVEQWQEEALKNSIRLWIGSFEGDIIGQPYRGGKVMRFLLKPMGQVNLKQFSGAMKKSFNDEFGGFAKMESLEITPVFNERKWEVSMVVSSYTLKLRTEIIDYIKGR